MATLVGGALGGKRVYERSAEWGPWWDQCAYGREKGGLASSGFEDKGDAVCIRAKGARPAAP